MLAGLFLPQGWLPPAPGGALLFKGMLVLLGLWVVVLRWLPIWGGPAAQAPPVPRREGAALGAILLLATGLRLYQLDAGLWFDEIVTGVTYVPLPVSQIVATYDSQNQHFLYSLMAHVTTLLFGPSPWTLRLPALLFGVGSIAALFVFARQVATAREATFAALLLTLSYHHIWFSQNARGYTGLLFWTLLASWLLVRAIREEGATLWVWYGVAAALGVYTHMTMLFVIASHFLVYLWQLVAHRRRPWPVRWGGLLAGFGLAGLLTLQLHALVLPQMFGGTLDEGGGVATWRNPFWTLLEFVRAVRVGFSGMVVGVAALALFGAGLWSYARRQPVVVALFLLPVVIGAAVVIGTGHHLWPRFFFFAFGFATLIAVRGAARFGGAAAALLRLPAAQHPRLAALACTGMITLSALSVPFVYGPKQDYQGALAFVEGQREPGDAIVTVGLASFPYQQLFHADWLEATTPTELDAIRSQAARTWVLYTIPIHLAETAPDLMRQIEDEFTLVRAFRGTLNGGEIFVRRADAAPDATTRRAPATERGLR